MFNYKKTIYLRESDSAGVVYFANHFNIAHEAYEALMRNIGFDVSKLIKNQDYVIPIVHASADYKKLAYPSDEITVEVTLELIKKTTFTLNYHLINAKGDTISKIKTVHVAIDKTSHKVIALPQDLKNNLEKI